VGVTRTGSLRTIARLTPGICDGFYWVPLAALALMERLSRSLSDDKRADVARTVQVANDPTETWGVTSF
jgi:hypothetical protein